MAARFVNRLTQPASRIYSCCLNPSRPDIRLLLKRQLSVVPLQISHDRSISPATSLRTRGVVQDYPSSWLSKAVRSYSSAEHSCSTKSAQMEENEGDTSLPNESWTPESFELYKKLTNDLMEQGNGDWVKHRTSLYDGERRLFTKAVISELPGKFFEYQFFYNQKEQRLKGVVQFGPYTQGPPGSVHGGASASMMDAAIGVCVNKCFTHCVTATLSMNYKSFLPLGTTALVESWVDKVEGRKIFGSAELKSPDGKVTYLTANALFIQLEPRGQTKE